MLLYLKGNYGTAGIDLFHELAKERGLCIANNLEAPNQQDDATHDRIIKTLIETDRARVIVCFCDGMTIRRLYEATERVPKAKGYFVILGSDGWADRPDVVSGIEETAAGGLSIKLLSKPILSFDKYFLSLRPEYNIQNPWFREYWQWKFGCYLDWLPLEEQDRSQNKSCTGKEYVTKHIQDAKLGYVVKAIYALAYALHNMHLDVCDGAPGICPSMIPIHGSLLIDYLMNVSFTSYSGEAVFFDKNGDPPPR
ncbi:hypothetical protein CHS0354_036324 [Potamilus streckersoni]|uniref:Receptor ligand binding region domain-containing protein n=1 Tax=Potamilus streckersoni TaxID=2493646 RepID=A0AAE0VFG0_9BIVA|nr:hypothetical protein CHS0354_036324 [Potamilus streckersoni]